FEVAARAILGLLAKPRGLLKRVGELRKRVGDLDPAGVELETVDPLGIARLLPRQRRDLGRELPDERRLDEVRLGHGLEDFRQELALLAAEPVRLLHTVAGRGRQETRLVAEVLR